MRYNKLIYCENTPTGTPAEKDGSPLYKDAGARSGANPYYAHGLYAVTEAEHMIKIAPSILSADFTSLASEVDEIRAAGADWLHFDSMDGEFVPNISIGLPVLESLRKRTDMFLDVHMMIARPRRYAARFCGAGADMVTVHVEADEPQYIIEALQDIKSHGKLAGLAVKPATPASVLLPYIDYLDMVLIMTVEPGFGGQSFMREVLSKLRGVSALLEQYKPGCLLEVDGGINADTAPLVVDSGANVLVAGNAVFGAPDRAAAVRQLRMASDVKA